MPIIPFRRPRRPRAANRAPDIRLLDQHMRADLGLPLVWDFHSARHLPF